MANFTEIQDALIHCDTDRLLGLVHTALADGESAPDILNKGLIPGMDLIGEKMENGDMFIPEVLMSAKAMGECVVILKSLLDEGDVNNAGNVIIGTVKGDLHDIGKNLVGMMMESTGLTVYNLGVDIAPEEFVRQIGEKNAQIVCLSALLTTTMPMMKQTIDAIVEAGLRDQVKVMIGGAPVTQSFADEIGADGFAPDAGSAARFAKNLVN